MTWRDRLIRRCLAREPDRDIGPGYMRRWYLWRTPLSCAYLHEFLRSDDDRALHDHPWPSLSLVLGGAGPLLEIAAGASRWIDVGDWTFRSARFAHRLIVLRPPVYTLFMTGPKIREWGFHCPQGWRHWRQYTTGPNGEAIGRGCD